MPQLQVPAVVPRDHHNLLREPPDSPSAPIRSSPWSRRLSIRASSCVSVRLQISEPPVARLFPLKGLTRRGLEGKVAAAGAGFSQGRGDKAMNALRARLAGDGSRFSRGSVGQYAADADLLRGRPGPATCPQSHGGSAWMNRWMLRSTTSPRRRWMRVSPRGRQSTAETC